MRMPALRMLCIGLALCGVAQHRASAQPAIDEFVSEAQARTQGNCGQLRVKFNVRLRHTGHLPIQRGEELRVMLSVVDRDAQSLGRLARREQVRIIDASRAAIRWATIESDMASGPVLTIHFERAVSFEITQSANLEDLTIGYALKESGGRCGADLRGAAPDGSAGQRESKASHSVRGALRAGRKPTDEDLKQIEAAMDEGRAALKKNNFAEAVKLFSNVLRYAEHKHSAEAQELLGVAFLKAGKPAQAQAEFDDYLRRYRTGEGSERVRQRLAGVVTATGGARERLEPGADLARGVRAGDKRLADRETKWTISGSASSFYIVDDSLNTVKDPSVAPNPNADPDAHRVHQSTLLSNFDVFGTAINDQMKTKFKFAATEEHRFTSGPEKWGISTAFIETILRESDVTLRLGRQSRNTGGVIGRFDGGVVSWQANESIRLNALAGSPNWSRFDLPFKDDKYLFGASADFGKMFGGLETSVFAIQQYDKSLIDRQAVGAELRYFDKNKSALATLDYDVYFRRLNAAIFSGSWTFADNSIVTAALDYRKVPYLSSWNALQGQPFLTLYDMLKYNTADEIRQWAIDRTPTFESAMIGYSRPLNDKWLLTTDATVTYLSGTPPSGGVDGVLPSGLEYYLSAQLTGTGIFKTGDMLAAAVRYAKLAQSDVYVLDLNSRYPVTADFRMSPRLRLGYRTGTSVDLTGTTTHLTETTVLPSILFNYMWTSSLAFEAEIGAKWIWADQSGIKTTTQNLFATVGVRKDFQVEGREDDKRKCAGTLPSCFWMPRAGIVGTPKPALGASPDVTTAFVLEGGLRYWYSTARNAYGYYADTTDAQLVSRLSYDGLSAHAGELTFRGDFVSGALRGVFVKGFVGGGGITGGNLFDEDLPPVIDPYSRTSSTTKGSLRYGAIDVGLNVYANDRIRIGAFAGYSYWFESVDAFGCNQTAGNIAICAPAIPGTVKVITERDVWNSIRVGGVVDLSVTDRLSWNGEVALLSTWQKPLDTHYLTFGADPADGRGMGFQAETMFKYWVTDKFNIGLGARWWHFSTTAVDSFGQLLKYNTDRYGVFVGANYRFH